MTQVKMNTNQYDINQDLFNKLKLLADSSNFTTEEQKKILIEDVSINNNLSLNLEKSSRAKNHSISTDTKNFRWFKYFFVKKPINLLFSLDQFLFEFSKKQHRKKKASKFHQQLKEQKKIALFYGNLSKKELTKIIENLKKYQGYFYKNFFCLIERRLDIVLYRSKFAKTIYLARQLITHKKILVNNKIIMTPSYILKSGDVISVHPKYLESLSKSVLLDSNKNRLNKKKFDHKVGMENYLKRFQNFINNKKSSKNLNLLINLLLKKINKRAFIKLRKTQLNYLTLIKYKPLISKPSNSLLFSLKQKNCLLSEKKPFFLNSKKSLFIQDKPRKFKNFQQYKNQNKKGYSNDSTYPQWKQKNSFQGNTKLKYNSKKKIMLYKNLILKTLVFMDSQFFAKQKINLEIKKLFLKKRKNFKKIKFSKFGGLKPLHLEISYKLLKIIYLYSPQRLNLPFYINIDLLSRAFK